MRALLGITFLLVLAAPAGAETVRVATYDVGLTREGAGVLLQELAGTPEADVAGVVAVIRAVRPDVLLLTGFDDDPRGRAIDAFRDLLRQGEDGIDYPERFHAPSNGGEPSGLDIDGDGRTSGWSDGFGWGKFRGAGSMVLLSRLPVDAEAARTFRLLPWRELPGAALPVREDGGPFPDEATQGLLRLSSRSHWDVPVVLPGGARLHLLASNPTPPLFDGGEGFNRRRNHDEIAFWTAYLDGVPLPDDDGRAVGLGPEPFVLLGNLNIDPDDGAGLRDGIDALLASPALRDPRPEGPGGSAEAALGANAAQKGDPALDTADWRDEDGGPGNLRTDYVLPSASLEVADAGVFWPAAGAPLAEAAEASAHRLVWVDLRLGP